MANKSFSLDRANGRHRYPSQQISTTNDNTMKNNAPHQTLYRVQNFDQSQQQTLVDPYTNASSFDFPSEHQSMDANAAAMPTAMLNNNPKCCGAHSGFDNSMTIDPALLDPSIFADDNALSPLICQDCGDELQAFGDDQLDVTRGTCALFDFRPENYPIIEADAIQLVGEEDIGSELGFAEVDDGEGDGGKLKSGDATEIESVGDESESESDDEITFFSDEVDAKACLADNDGDVVWLGSDAYDDDYAIFTPEVIKAEAKDAYRLFKHLDPTDKLPTKALRNIVIDKSTYDNSQQKELDRISEMLVTTTQRQHAAARATLALSSVIKLHRGHGVGVRIGENGVRKKRNRRNIVGDYKPTASVRWAKIKRAIRVNKFVARDVLSGNPKLLEELVRNPDLYLHMKFDNFKNNNTKGTTLKAATKKKQTTK
ncbi:hypothetical protein B0A48_13917 [Cryoendolithus antarcticus]|uniref:Uncharacterized protein n=1 Tax=Cryoendolithus antarcticus TaxID=1507870 RepID=A0A1V8SM21_9PEZI|nr:hypothetical protein B0A48_13917 [Cryoendolithus antarcticus]